MRYLLLALSLLFAAPTAFARSGHTVNNGVDQRNVFEDAVWFADGSRTIRACVQAAPDFGVDAATAAGEVEKAFGIWDAYITEKRVRTGMQARGTSIATKVNVAVSCKGDEDLAFYLGVENPITKAALKDFTRPLGFARRTAFDEKTLWGKGFVWIAHPTHFAENKLDWSQQNRLLGVLLHEIGHVLGNGHVSGTIMRDNLGDELLRDMPPFINTYDQVDSGRQLVFCSGCPVDMKGTFFQRSAIEKFLGTTLSARTEVSFTLRAEFQKDPVGLLAIRDAGKTFELRAEVGSNLTTSSTEVSLFKVPKSQFFGGYTTFTHGALNLITLNHEGRELLLALKRNLTYTSGKDLFEFQIISLDPRALDNRILVFNPLKP